MTDDPMPAPMTREEFEAAVVAYAEAIVAWRQDENCGADPAGVWYTLLAHDAALRAALAAAERERDDWHATVKAITDEWNEECPAGCDSFAHVEDCAAVSIASAMRDRRKRAEVAEARAAQLEDGLRAVWESVPATHDERDPLVQRHAAALNAIPALLAPRPETEAEYSDAR